MTEYTVCKKRTNLLLGMQVGAFVSEVQHYVLLLLNNFRFVVSIELTGRTDSAFDSSWKERSRRILCGRLGGAWGACGSRRLKDHKRRLRLGIVNLGWACANRSLQMMSVFSRALIRSTMFLRTGDSGSSEVPFNVTRAMFISILCLRSSE